MTPAEIISEINKLPPGEWEKIKESVDIPSNRSTNGSSDPQMTEEEFARHLLAKGIISSIPTGETDEEFDDFELIAVEGEPLSEMIVRERR